MLHTPTFWDHEKDAPLLTLNKGYLQAQGDKVFTRTSTWMKQAGVDSHEPVELATVENPDRIFVADAERTFRTEADRAQFVKLLAHLAAKFGDYAQGLSYVASFLSLTLSEAEVVALLTHLNFNEKYVPGYWKHEAVGFATDAYVFQELVAKFHPDIASHLQKNFIDPSSYCQKWFVGLCVHVLPFEHLFQYFEGFLKGGHKFLKQFGLSLLNQLKDKLLALHNNPSATFGLLRLDPKFIPHDNKFDEMIKRVFEGVKDYNLDSIDFKDMRVKAFDTHLKARLASAKASHDKAKESDDEIEDCEICKDDFPEVYCKECKLKICESCHNKPPAKSTHLRAHKVKPIEEDEEEEEESSDDEDEKEKSDAAVDKTTANLSKLNV